MFDDDEKVLSQSDIDAMLATLPEDAPPVSTSTAKEAEPEQYPVPEPPAAPAPSGTAPSKVDGGPVSAGIADSLQATLADVVKRLSKIENVMERLEQLEKKVAQISADSGKSPQNQQALENVKELEEQIEEISDNLRSSLGYGVRKIFRCKYCKSKGLVALHVKCTDCGEETWLGWWPKE